MSASASGRKTPVDYGVQIRFINDLHDTGGGGGGRRDGSGKSSSRYGVAVRVQGIAGQPYVMLKDGRKGDSYGVQLRTPSYSSLPRYTHISYFSPFPACSTFLVLHARCFIYKDGFKTRNVHAEARQVPSPAFQLLK